MIVGIVTMVVGRGALSAGDTYLETPSNGPHTSPMLSRYSTAFPTTVAGLHHQAVHVVVKGYAAASKGGVGSGAVDDGHESYSPSA